MEVANDCSRSSLQPRNQNPYRRRRDHDHCTFLLYRLTGFFCMMRNGLDFGPLLIEARRKHVRTGAGI